jgi:hypothetical protein
MNANNQPIVIETFTIRQDAEGRYCLNDLHKASGGLEKDRPLQWLRSSQADGLIKELESARICAVSTKMGRNGGSFVVRELVYAYAMWISPAFNLKVIRAFDRLQTQGVAVADHSADDVLKNPIKYMRALLDQAEEITKENARLAALNYELEKGGIPPVSTKRRG